MHILVGRTKLKLVKNAKIIGNEECISQHKLLFVMIKIHTPSKKPRVIVAKLKLLRLREPEVQAKYQNLIK